MRYFCSRFSLFPLRAKVARPSPLYFVSSTLFSNFAFIHCSKVPRLKTHTNSYIKTAILIYANIMLGLPVVSQQESVFEPQRISQRISRVYWPPGHCFAVLLKVKSDKKSKSKIICLSDQTFPRSVIVFKGLYCN